MDESPHAEDWEQTYERLAPKLLLYARQWLPRLEDAEDAVHDAFLRIWKRRHERMHDAYYFAATRSAALDLHRSGSRRIAREQLLFATGQPPRADGGLNAEDAGEALQALPNEQRESVVLKIWGGLTFAEIGRVTGVSTNTAASRYRYGIEAMRKHLEIPAA